MTFWRAQERARAAGGNLILRIEDLDVTRCRPEFFDAIIEDLKWFGFEWGEGPDVGGAFAPYVQSERRKFYLDTLEKLRAAGSIYPCRCSRRDVLEAAVAPHDENQEPIYPGTCRPVVGAVVSAANSVAAAVPAASETEARCLPPQSRLAGISWRFRAPDGEQMKFVDEHLGRQSAVAGKDFGDFIIWRRDNVPAYQLAVVVDDVAMQITEVVRGEDLLLSTFRQLLLYRALNLKAPKFYHAPLIVDEAGMRLAKRQASLSVRALREAVAKPEEIRRPYLL
jgi:glutamyl/glutaminyl-tRNA synthetase